MVVNVAIKGVSVGSITLESDGDPSITVRWCSGESMTITGPAMLVFRYRHRRIVLYWDGRNLVGRSLLTVLHAFPRCMPCLFANPSDFCTVLASYNTDALFLVPRYFSNILTIDDL